MEQKKEDDPILLHHVAEGSSRSMVVESSIQKKVDDDIRRSGWKTYWYCVGKVGPTLPQKRNLFVVTMHLQADDDVVDVVGFGLLPVRAIY